MYARCVRFGDFWTYSYSEMELNIRVDIKKNNKLI